jgi:hypothetical protein
MFTDDTDLKTGSGRFPAFNPSEPSALAGDSSSAKDDKFATADPLRG